MRWLAAFALVAAASAQIPSLGWCPDYQPMENFNMNRFLGTWYETERYFTVSEVGTRCVTSTYDKTPEGMVIVSNEIVSSITGFKRVLDGVLQMVGQQGEGRINVKYSSLPVPFDSDYVVLDTDYDNYAVIWSCSGIGPVHTQNAWLMTRERIPTVPTMQSAYGVLDKFKISRAFFVKTDQGSCTVLPEPVEKSAVAGKNADKVVEAVDVEKALPVPEEVVKVVEQKEVQAEVKSAYKAPQVPHERVAVPEEPQKAEPEIKKPEAEKETKMKEEPLKSDNPEAPKEEKAR